MAPDITSRYQSAGELLNEVLGAREPVGVRKASRAPLAGAAPAAAESVADIQSRLKAREAPQPRFCWHCRKPLQARTERCPFCNEAQ